MKLLQLTPWPILPPISGGQERCYNIAKQLGKITSYSLDWQGRTGEHQAEDIHYKVIPADGKAIDQARKLLNAGVRTYDPIPMLARKNLNTIRQAIDELDPDLILLEHPWLLDLIGDRPYIYDSHNCETLNSINLLGQNALEIDLIKDMERRAVQGAQHLLYTSETDLNNMRRLFPFDTPATLIPNGCTPPAETATGRSRNLVFIGSMYGPNITAARNLIDIAPYIPDYTIQILGACANAVGTNQPNVQLVGPVTNAQLNEYLLNAHAFVNLVEKGSGTHLKVARALSYGLPVITTDIGARGYTSPIITTGGNLESTLDAVEQAWEAFSHQALEEASQLTWDTIGTKLRTVFSEL